MPTKSHQSYKTRVFQIISKNDLDKFSSEMSNPKFFSVKITDVSSQNGQKRASSTLRAQKIRNWPSNREIVQLDPFHFSAQELEKLTQKTFQEDH